MRDYLDNLQDSFTNKVKVEVNDGNAVPVIIRPVDDLDFNGWISENKSKIQELITKVGAILFRGMKIEGPSGFNQAFSKLFGEPMSYTNRTSPRNSVKDRIYTSTTHPKDQPINLHTENSYSPVANRIISFFCETVPGKDGQTPIAPEWNLTSVLTDQEIQKFKEKGILYERNVIEGVGLSWQETYQTTDKLALEKKFEDLHINHKWLSDEHLKLNWVLPAFQDHPITQESMWFNHMYFYHSSLYDPGILEYFGEENLPFATYYGDGTSIEKEIIDKVKHFYDQHTILFDWEQSDFLLLDNLKYAHGRKPFEGDRLILTAMAEPFDLEAHAAVTTSFTEETNNGVLLDSQEVL